MLTKDPGVRHYNRCSGRWHAPKRADASLPEPAPSHPVVAHQCSHQLSPHGAGSLPAGRCPRMPAAGFNRLHHRLSKRDVVDEDALLPHSSAN